MGDCWVWLTVATLAVALATVRTTTLPSQRRHTTQMQKSEWESKRIMYSYHIQIHRVTLWLRVSHIACECVAYLTGDWLTDCVSYLLLLFKANYTRRHGRIKLLGRLLMLLLYESGGVIEWNGGYPFYLLCFTLRMPFAFHENEEYSNIEDGWWFVELTLDRLLLNGFDE